MSARPAGFIGLVDARGAWLTFRGDDGMPLTDIIVELGKARRVVWMPQLYPPARQVSEPEYMDGSH